MKAESLERLRQEIQKIYLTATAELGVAQISVGDILGLQVGDVLKLTTKVDGDLVLKIENRKKFLCRPGVVGNRMAVQVTRINGKG